MDIDTERYRDFGSLCHCGMKLLGDMQTDSWVCEGCLLRGNLPGLEEDCDCEPE